MMNSLINLLFLESSPLTQCHSYLMAMSRKVKSSTLKASMENTFIVAVKQ